MTSCSEERSSLYFGGQSLEIENSVPLTAGVCLGLSCSKSQLVDQNLEITKLRGTGTGADETEFLIFAGGHLTPVGLTKQRGAEFQLG